MRLTFFTATLLAVLALPASAIDYDVGPGQPLAAIADVPWESLMPGDTVRIHWRPEPYREKWVIGRSGAPGMPITVQGVRGPGGERPVISGENATTPAPLNFWNEVRGLIKIGGSSVPPNTTPEWIVIEGLELRSAHRDYSFTDDGGNTATYVNNAAGVYVEYGRNIVVRDCEIHDCGNGIFMGSPADNPTTNVLIEGNHLHGNGNVGSVFEHNSYTTCLDIVFQNNLYEALRPGADGNNLKDRSGGLVVRYNWIRDGNRQLDLVESSPGSQIAQDPRYLETHVYGNVLIEGEGEGNRQMVHYGGDNGDQSSYRKGTLHFYNNTVVSERAGRSTLFRLSTNDETADARNNVLFQPNATGDQFELVNDAGTLNWSHNWAETGWVFSFFGTLGTFNDDGTTVEGSDPGFVDEAGGDYRLLAGSALRDAGTTLAAAVLPAHELLWQPVLPRASEPRPVDATLDIGAIEFASVSPPEEARDLRVDSASTIDWQPAPNATSHDLLRGDLALLASTGLGGSVLECLTRAAAGTSFVDTLPLPPSGAAWYLARGRNAAGVGTWGPGRDAELDAAPAGCLP